MTLPSPTTLDAEMAVAVDPRGNGVAYAVTIQGGTSPQAFTTGGTCLVTKHIAVFRFAQDDPNPNAPAGPHWFQMPGSETIPSPSDQWATDPWLSVGGDGTLYLTFLRNRSFLNEDLRSLDSDHVPLTACEKGVDFADSAVELWIAPPDPSDPTHNQPLQPAPLVVTTPTVYKFTPMPAIEQATHMADYPKLVASRTVPGLVFMTGRNNALEAGGGQEFIAAYQRNTNGQFERKGHLSIAKATLQPVLAADDAGFIYAVVAINDDQNSPTFGVSPVVKKFQYDGTAITQVASGSPPVVPNVAYGNTTTLEIPSAKTKIPSGSPSIAIARLGNSTDNIVYLAFDAFDGNGNKMIELRAANTRDLNSWSGPVFSQALAPSFTPIISVDGKSNTLDLLYFGFDRSAGSTASTMNLAAFFTRFDAGRMVPIAGPTRIGTVPGALPIDLPIRHGPLDKPGGPFPLDSLFIGEYLALATTGLNAIAGFPTLTTSPRNVDLGIVQVRSSCPTAVTMANREWSWECDCNCQSGGGQSSAVTMVGCAVENSTAGSACGAICTQRTPCGNKLTCGGTAICSATGTGRLISQDGCAMSDSRALDSPPANTADFTFNTGAASTATITMAGQPATTALNGSVFFNASTSPPTAGATADIAWLKVRPADMFVGGSVGQFVRNMNLTHMNRLQGTFTDSTHFTIAPGAAEFVLTLQTEPTEGEISDPISIRAANPDPMTGAVNLQAGTFTLDGTAGDGAGSSLTIHVDSTIVSRPPDSDHDGIIDAVDKCPGATVGPDRTPPQFTFVPPDITTSSCTGVSLGVAKATDPCGVTVTNNAPTKFPLGVTLVTWTARDGAGNIARATQTVTAVMGNSTSCCPAGSKIIIGTSNNDVLVGTSGPDCILGLGGQDTISGGGGDDVLSGGDGDDIISGQGGNDRLYGGSGQDQLSGGPGNDILDGGDGDDRINGDDGDDTIEGGQGQDICFGGIGNDNLSGGTGDDQLHGNDGNDRLSGGEDNDRLFGESGDDLLNGDRGDDQMDGGTGVNTLLGGGGHDICIDAGVTEVCGESNGDGDE